MEKQHEEHNQYVSVYLIICLFMGTVCATDTNNLKVPDGWKAIGGGSYHQEGISRVVETVKI